MRYSIFSLQVVMPLKGPDDPLFKNLHRMLRAAPANTNYTRMHDYYSGLCKVLRAESHRFERGVWDYWDDPARAPGDFQDWVNGLQGKEARTEPEPEDGRPRYMACTLAMLLQYQSASDQRLLKHCTIPQAELWRRETFHELLKAPALLNFLHVKSHLAYLLPGEDVTYGLTERDLAGKDWHYLRRLD